MKQITRINVKFNTGRTREAQVFVAVLGASSKTYAEASWHPGTRQLDRLARASLRVLPGLPRDPALCSLRRYVAEYSVGGARERKREWVMALQRIKPLQQVRRLAPAADRLLRRFSADGRQARFDSGDLGAHADLRVAVRSVKRDVAEPPSNHIELDPCLQQMDGRAVAEYMGRDGTSRPVAPVRLPLQARAWRQTAL